MPQSRPVFIHSGFRVSSTWFWTKLRDLPGITAYYEVFHERLAQVDRDGIDRFNTACWDSRHPHTAPYFREYLGLTLPGGGVRGYREQMAYRDFVPDGGIGADLAPATADYVAGLIDAADACGNRAVLTCGRSLGRIAGLRRTFGGTHVLLLRDLAHQWESYLRLGNDGTWYFHNATLSVLANGRFNDTFLASLHDAHTQSETCRGDVTLLRFKSLADYFAAFVGIHLYFYLAAFSQVDLILNVSAMAADPAMLSSGTTRFMELTGLAPDLGDIRGERTQAGERLTLTTDEAARLLDTASRALGLEGASEAVGWGGRLLGSVTR